MTNESIFYMSRIFTISRENLIVLMHKASKTLKDAVFCSELCNLFYPSEKSDHKEVKKIVNLRKRRFFR